MRDEVETATGLVAIENGFPLLQERAYTFLRIRRSPSCVDSSTFVQNRLSQALALESDNGVQHTFDSQARLGGEFLAQGLCPRFQLLNRTEF